MLSTSAYMLPTTAAPCTLSVPASVPGALQTAVNSLATLLSTKIDTADDVVICLVPGIHRLDQPLKLSSALLHNHPHGGRVVWRGHPTRSTMISGGASLKKWGRCFDGTHCNWPEWNDVWVHYDTCQVLACSSGSQNLPRRPGCLIC